MPTRTVRATLLIVLAVTVTAAAVWLAAAHQRHAADRWASQSRTAETMLTAMLDQDSGLRGFILSGEPASLTVYADGRNNLAAATITARSNAAGSVAALDAIDAQESLATRWQALAEQEIARVRTDGPGPAPVANSLARKRLLDRYRAVNERLENLIDTHGSSAQTQAAVMTVAIIVVLSAIFAVIGYVSLVRPARRDAGRRIEEDDYLRTQTEFTDLLQVTRTEGEAQQLLQRHVARTIPESSVFILNRNNSADRLEAVTTLAEDPVLGRRLAGAAPASCLALRLARPHHEMPEGEGLMGCELCGSREQAASCRPLLVGGEVIGSVLVHHSEPLSDEQSRRLSDSIRQAAPVLANLRNLAIAENRAATDALTGLANRRALEDTMKRMLAHANRTVSPLAVLAIDLDHFKRVNDAFGHEQGDSVLAAVGDVLGSTVRASDFVARYGGEEFIVIAPDTDGSAAMILAEKLRRAISTISVPGAGGGITGSIGVAAFPEHGTDVEILMRAADRALYAAKERGRNRIEIASQGSAVAGVP